MRLLTAGRARSLQVSQTLWGDWVEMTSSAKAAMYRNIWWTGRNSSAPVTSAVAVSTMGYNGAPLGLGQNGGNCVGMFFFSFGWTWQAHMLPPHGVSLSSVS